METFVVEPCYGSGPRFDPMMEERKGWIIGEVPRNDVEDMIEVLAEASKHTLEDINPFKAQLGEILPTIVERNFSSFLEIKDAITFKVDS